jgi:hypothetical protein
VRVRSQRPLTSQWHVIYYMYIFWVRVRSPRPLTSQWHVIYYMYIFWVRVMGSLLVFIITILLLYCDYMTNWRRNGYNKLRLIPMALGRCLYMLQFEVGNRSWIYSLKSEVNNLYHLSRRSLFSFLGRGGGAGQKWFILPFRFNLDNIRWFAYKLYLS